MPPTLIFAQVSPAMAGLGAAEQAREAAEVAGQGASRSLADSLAAYIGHLWSLPAWVNIAAARMLLVIATFVAAWLALCVVRYLITGIGRRMLEGRLGAESRGRAETLAQLFFSISKYVIYFLAFITALYQANVNPAPFLGGAAVIGLAVGFGSQDLVKDVVTGIFILIENQFSIGEYVDLGGKSGVVVGMSVRRVTIRDDNGRLHNLPYRSITVVSNSSRARAAVVADVYLAKVSDEAAAPGVLQNVLALLRVQMKPMIKDFAVKGIINPGTRQNLVRAVVKCRPNRVDIVKGEIERVLKEEFAAAGIEIKDGLIRFYSAPREAA